MPTNKILCCEGATIFRYHHANRIDYICSVCNKIVAYEEIPEIEDTLESEPGTDNTGSDGVHNGQ